jgi:hypothetical protein
MMSRRRRGFVAYAMPSLTSEERVLERRQLSWGNSIISSRYFWNFVLAHCVGVGVDELDQEKLSPLLRLKYRAISDGWNSETAWNQNPVRSMEISSFTSERNSLIEKIHVILFKI